MDVAAETLPAIERYVAIGDSQTEGLHDYHPDGMPRGWADRLAEALSARNPALRYANLAVRGKRTAQIRQDQLGPGLSLEPDLVTVVSGVNDVVRPGCDVDAVAADLEAMYAAFAATGCLVMSCTFPLPATGLTRRAAPRLAALNQKIRAAAHRTGTRLVEIEPFPDAADLRLWAEDRIHLNADGHRRLGAAFASTLASGQDIRWAEALEPVPTPSRIASGVSELAWLARFAAPKIVRMLRGRSSGDGRSAKRPELTPLR